MHILYIHNFYIYQIFTDFFPALFISSYYISDDVSIDQWRSVIGTLNHQLVSAGQEAVHPFYLSVFYPNAFVFLC